MIMNCALYRVDILNYIDVNLSESRKDSEKSCQTKENFYFEKKYLLLSIYKVNINININVNIKINIEFKPFI